MDATELKADREQAAAPPWRPGALYATVLVVCLAVYAATAQRGPAWQDSGIYQLRILDVDMSGQRGLALSHPLLIVLGKALSMLPLGALAWRMNLLSALCGAVAAANVALLVRRLAPRPRGAAMLAAAAFALAHTTWWLATICESQALLAALFTTELHLVVSLVRRPRARVVFLLAGANGLALSAHNLALLALPAYVVIVAVLCARRRLGWSAVLWFAVGWGIGAGLFLALVAGAWAQFGPAEAMRSALFGRGWQGQVLGLSGHATALGAGYILFNFPNLALPLAAAGIWSMRKQLGGGLACVLGYLAAVYFAFAIRYAVADQFMFFLPLYAMISALAGIGLARLCRGRGRRWLLPAAAASLLVGPVAYTAAPAACRWLDVALPGRKDLPFRDPARYWLTPWKTGEESADRFARSALREVPDGAVIVADHTSLPPLLWAQRVDGLRTDVLVLAEDKATPGRTELRSRRTFVVSDQPGYHPAWLDRAARLQRDQGKILFAVLWR